MTTLYTERKLNLCNPTLIELSMPGLYQTGFFKSSQKEAK
jgi:hypothetical protein